MAFAIVYAALDGRGYQNPKVGQSDGSLNGTGVRMDLSSTSYTDLRLNSFVDGNGTGWVEMCNRSGSAGQPGAGKHWAYNLPVPTSLPAEKTGLSTIANPYATVYYGGYMYINEYDGANIYAVNIPAFTLANRGQPVFTYTKYAGTKSAVDLEVVGDRIYALFSSGQGYTGPYDPSSIVRLTKAAGGPGLSASDPADYASIGMNAFGMTKVSYQPQGASDVHEYLLAACIGGTQGTGNGADSMVSVVDITDTNIPMVVLTNPVDGTYNSLDIKAVAATPPSTVANPGEGELATGDSFIYIMAASYDANWQTQFAVAQTKASYLIEKAIANVTENIGDSGYIQVIEFDTGYWGYFWTVAFVPSGSGSTGDLIVGLGDKNYTQGDALRVFPVTATGADKDVSTLLTSSTLYGVAGCALNTMTILPAAATRKAITLRAAVPHPVASGTSSMADFLAEMRKKAGVK